MQIVVGYDLTFPGEIIALETGKFGVRFVNNMSYAQRQTTDLIDLDKEPDTRQENTVISSTNSNPFEFLEKIESSIIAGLIQNEESQMIAMILSFKL